MIQKSNNKAQWRHFFSYKGVIKVMGVARIAQSLSDSFYKGTHGKYLRLCGPEDSIETAVLCHTVAVNLETSMCCVSIKLY